ncbi:hypothetical protein TetV_599 [Tetraselmis virus 1]|uniref:Uncharacterized protein n=1 Tax=Tetraselmis virus 1 TaxID=2060617 RepID=A0A2P0VP63_9VIRU|nr:hypothetical protein QJ968_gp455 [Tetraselmis virus 1]AUF82681.1 hypothetical protein TetV_599 [Tetraselmis virus 1]
MCVQETNSINLEMMRNMMKNIAPKKVTFDSNIICGLRGIKHAYTPSVSFSYEAISESKNTDIRNLIVDSIETTNNYSTRMENLLGTEFNLYGGPAERLNQINNKYVFFSLTNLESNRYSGHIPWIILVEVHPESKTSYTMHARCVDYSTIM